MLVFALMPVRAQIPFLNSRDAGGVLGQPGFTTSDTATSATGTNRPVGVAVDPTTGKLVVAEFHDRCVPWFGPAATS